MSKHKGHSTVCALLVYGRSPDHGWTTDVFYLFKVKCLICSQISQVFQKIHLESQLLR